MRVIAASGAKVDVRPLPEILHNGLLAPGIIGLSSVIATSLLISFLLFRLYQWKKEHKSVASYVSLPRVVALHDSPADSFRINTFS